MKNSSLALRAYMVIVLTVGFASLGIAQNREKYVISATAGGVNWVTGQVTIKRAGQAERSLSDRDNLVSGDVVSTAVGSKIEVLLNPGSYLRVGEGSEFELVDNSLANLRVKLIRGSAIVEATGFDNTELRIALVTDQGHFMIARRGVYRFNEQPASTDLMVQKGRILIGDNAREMVKGGNKVTLSGGSIVRAKLTKRDRDELDVWSKQRAETLARANERLANRSFNGYLSSFNRWDWAFSAANPWGLWAFSPFAHCFTFVPFFYGWSSPYGHYYGSYYNVYYFNGFGRQPVIVNNQPPNGPFIGPGSGSRVSSGGGSSGGSGVGSSGGSGVGSGGSAPVIQPPASPPMRPSRPPEIDSRDNRDPSFRRNRPRDPKYPRL